MTDKENCRKCDHWKGRKSFKKSCSRTRELLFCGGTLTGEQLMEDTERNGCTGFRKRLPVVTEMFATCTTCGNDRMCACGRIRDSRGKITQFTICEKCASSGEYEYEFI